LGTPLRTTDNRMVKIVQLKIRDQGQKTGELQTADRKDESPESLRMTLNFSAWLVYSSPVNKSPV
jgi:hypothetical protein